ncbi:outer membrane protein assembly factor BamE domain-containing protein [Burkholderia ubonensis]|uniref:outer membrane protein assembly factor BamE domain-containing protein n=1 Tax=Burkholderia ubonensis TaxID=101571 RepID=UPI001E5F5279|nr:outer membrane protein assembly factor BamE [Burkholderia ubonensis]
MDAISAINPDAMAFGNLQPGVSTVDDLRRQAGKPEMVWQSEEELQRLEHPRGPNSTSTYMVDVGSAGRLIATIRVLNAANIAKVVPGMTLDDVRQVLGQPMTIAQYALSHETAWSWHWEEDGVSRDAMFNAHFSPEGVVIRTSRSEAPRHEQH